MTIYRKIALGGFLICLFLLLAAYYFQYVEHLEPCPLCIIQRFFVAFIGVFCLLGFFQAKQPWARRIYGVLIFLGASLGAATAARHLWLQYHPPAEVSCTAGLDMMLANLPFGEVIDRVFTGLGDCTKISWQWLGLSMPAWTLLAFCGLGVLGILFLRTNKKG